MGPILLFFSLKNFFYVVLGTKPRSPTCKADAGFLSHFLGPICLCFPLSLIWPWIALPQEKLLSKSNRGIVGFFQKVSDDPRSLTQRGAMVDCLPCHDQGRNQADTCRKTIPSADCSCFPLPKNNPRVQLCSAFWWMVETQHSAAPFMCGLSSDH